VVVSDGVGGHQNKLPDTLSGVCCKRLTLTQLSVLETSLTSVQFSR
jgi:hypothetical protein